MVNVKKLENYLAKLDKSLGQISVSEKADIITEIKSHVMDALEKDQSQKIETVLSSLGEPEQVANRYLMERGLKLQSTPKHPIVKWLVVGFLGTFSLVLIFVCLLLWKFTPFIQVNEEKGTVKLMGGLIDINENSGEFKISSDIPLFDGKKVKYNGSYEIDPMKVTTMKLHFTNGSMKFKTAHEDKVSWQCKIKGLPADMKSNIDQSIFNLDLSKSDGSECIVSIPKGLTVRAVGANGDIKLIQPDYDFDLELSNGKVTV